MVQNTVQNTSFIRKVTYGFLIAVLMIPLYMLSRPAVRESNGELNEGGVLAQMRKVHRLSQANLGEIDPASESMKLATLGMPGIAANLLWERANRYKRQHDWDNLTATLNQISKLQPNFISVWQFQGWNLAYNVSVEFDDYRSRYHWVKRGIDYLRDGIRHNYEEPVLPWEIGWTFGHKIGKADEYVQFRRLYRNDEDFHDRLRPSITIENTLGPEKMPDNWLSGREWFLKAQQLVDNNIPIRGRLVDDTGRIKRGKTPLIFHSHPPKWLINYAEAIEEEGHLDETAKFAWMRAAEQWDAYGDREIPTTYGFRIRLNSGEQLEEQTRTLGKHLDKVLPGVRERLREEKRQQLSEEARRALDTPIEQRTDEQLTMARSAASKVNVSYAEIAAEAPPEKRREVNRLVRLGQAAQSMSDAVDNYRNQVNYLYWRLRTAVEQTDTAIAARKNLYDAQQAYESADLVAMRTNYEQSFQKWAEIFEKHPVLMEDTIADQVMEAIGRYQWVLSQLDETWPPEDFPLHDFIRLQEELYGTALE